MKISDNSAQLTERPFNLFPPDLAERRRIYRERGPGFTFVGEAMKHCARLEAQFFEALAEMDSVRNRGKHPDQDV